MLKNVLKFLGIAVGIVIVGAGALWGVQYWQYRTSPEYRALQDLKNLQKQYAEDPYGGNTPEETLRLFIDALKKGDTDLASKYFILDKQEEWRNDLLIIKEKGLLDEMVRDLENTKLENKDSETARYFFVTEENLSSPVVLVKSVNGKWKIRTL